MRNLNFKKYLLSALKLQEI